MTAASLDVLTGGRFRLGLGVSGPQVSEGWHGVRFDKPLTRTREYVAVVSKALSRSTVTFSGEHYQLPLPDGPGKPLKLTIAPISEHIPIYLAAVGPKNLELAGELADGWLAIFYAPQFAPEQLDRVRSGRARVGKSLDGFDVVPSVPLVVGADPRSCADQVRGYAALYLGGMGSRERNFYNALAVRMGFGETAAMVQDLFLSRRHRDAMAAVPFDFIDQTSLLGDRDRIADGFQLLAASGVTTCALVPYGGSVEEKLNALTVAAEALERSGVGVLVDHRPANASAGGNGLSTPVMQQDDHERGQCKPIDHERQERMRAHVTQQPSDHRVTNDKRDHGGQRNRAPGRRHRVSGDVGELEQAGTNHGWYGEQEGVLGGRHPLVAER